MIFVIIGVAILGVINSGCTPQPVDAPASIVQVQALPSSAPSAAPVLAPAILPSPVPSVLPSPVPSASPAPVTTESFIYFNAAGICAAFHDWDSRVTTIVFPVNSSPTGLIYTFEDDGVFIGARDGTGKAPLGYGGDTHVIQVNGGTPTVNCTITVNDGHFEGAV